MIKSLTGFVTTRANLNRFCQNLQRTMSDLVRFQENVIQTVAESTDVAVNNDDKDNGVVDMKNKEAQAYMTNHALKMKRKNEMRAEKKRLLKERRALKKETKEVGFNFNDTLKQTDYYFENNLRKVYPYNFYWNTTAKERWFGRTLYEIYKTEFSRAIVNQPLEQLILTGKIQVNGQTKSLDYVIKNGDRICHTKHRHEIPVLDDQIKVIHDGEDYLVVNKPCSIPMHPCGKYRYNSLSIILAKEFRYRNLRTLYRLDRLTSGLVILGKNFKAALVLDKAIKERTAVKTYVSRVIGAFPEGRIVVDKAIDCASRKIGLYWLDEDKGKESTTEFERLSYDNKSNTSVVLCYPKTGRTHQIRIHLQYLGHPIVNDPLYNQPTVWGETNGKGGIYGFNKEQIEQNFLNIHTYEAWIIKQEENDTGIEKKEDGQTSADHNVLINKKRKINEEFESDKVKNESTECETNRDTDIEKYQDTKNFTKKFKNGLEEVESFIVQDTLETQLKSNKKSNGTLEKELKNNNRPSLDKSRIEFDPECFECSQKYRDPQRSDLIMYLHALSYKFAGIEFETELPDWAKKDFEE